MGRDQLIPLGPKLFMPRHVAGHLFHGCLLTLSSFGGDTLISGFDPFGVS